MAKVNSADGTVIGYDRTGSGPVVILVDGAFSHRGYRGGRPLAAALASDFTVVAYDRRGRGESTDVSPYSVEREVDDLAAIVDEVGSPACVYGFSSGAVLALRAAARLGGQVARLVLHEPPFGGSDAAAKLEFATYAQQIAALISERRSGEAVSLFLSGMLPPDVLAEMKRSPDWALMEAVAHTLVYDNAVMGDGAIPTALAGTVAAPTWIIDCADSPDFKCEAADALATAMPRAKRTTLQGYGTQVPPEVLAPVLREWLTEAL
jgi:pimeloyl-ACP methyl ester carboxylesterase